MSGNMARVRIPTSFSKRVAKRIKKEFNIEVKPVIYRTYAGRWQRSRGAWSWWMELKDSPIMVGSAFPARDILKAKKLSISDTDNEIFIEAEDNNYYEG